jgi:hypothetical protein
MVPDKRLEEQQFQLSQQKQAKSFIRVVVINVIILFIIIITINIIIINIIMIFILTRAL